jgi:putative transposase
MDGPRSAVVVFTRLGREPSVSQGTSVEDRDVEASRRLAEALDPSVIDALLADAKSAGTPIGGVDGLLNKMTRAVIERALAVEMTLELGYER